MKDLILVGGGGCVRDIIYQLEWQNSIHPVWNLIGIVDQKSPEKNKQFTDIYKRYPWLGQDEYLISYKEKISVAICVGNPTLRRRIAENLEVNTLIQFPNIIMEDVRIAQDVQLGKGCIVSEGSRITGNGKLGNFVFVNFDCIICHDSSIGNYVSINPGVKIAGNVTISENSEVGIGACVIQGIRIGSDTVVGAGAAVVRDLPSGCTAVGVPARPIKKNK